MQVSTNEGGFHPLHNAKSRKDIKDKALKTGKKDETSKDDVGDRVILNGDKIEKKHELKKKSRKTRNKTESAKHPESKEKKTGKADKSGLNILHDTTKGTMAVFPEEVSIADLQPGPDTHGNGSEANKLSVEPINEGERQLIAGSLSTLKSDGKEGTPRFTHPADPQIKAAPYESKTTKPNPIEAFAVPIRWIKDPAKREFAENALKACQQEFFTAPASFSGKYHPKESLGEGGLVRHVRKVAFYARRVADVEGLSPEERDELITAAILHDICKGGIPWKGYAADHGPLAEKWLENFDPKGDFTHIRHLIGMHMGDFNRPLPTPPKTKMEHLICEADMLGSSKALGVENLEWNKESEVSLAGAEQGNDGSSVPIISSYKDCLDQISDGKIKEFAALYLGGSKTKELSPETRIKFIYALDLCRIEKVEGELYDQVLAAVLLQKARVPVPTSYEDAKITRLKTLIQRPAHFYPEQGKKLVQKVENFGEISPESIDKFVNLENKILKSDKPLEGVAHSLDFRSGDFNLGEVEESLKRISKVARELRGHPELLKKKDKALSESLGNLKATHKLLHTAVGIQGWTKEISRDLEKTHLIMSDVSAARERMKEMDRTIKWEKITSALGNKIDPVTKEYFFYNADINAPEMIEVIKLMREMESGEGNANIGGNDITPLHRQEIWQQKMQMIDEAIEHPEANGKPVEIDVEYYELSNNEMLRKLTEASHKGCHIRVIIDPGHAPNRGKGRFDLSDIARRMKTVQTLLLGSENENISVVMFPAKSILGSKDALMHRKLFRVGDQVILGGMNANAGSGENIDAAQLVQGPAAKRLVEIFRDDMSLCREMNGETLYGTQVMEIIAKGKYINRSKEEVTTERIISPGAFRDLVEAAADVMGIYEDISAENIRQLDGALKKKGINITELAQFHDLDGDGVVTENDIAHFLSRDMVSEIILTDKGGELLAQVMERTLALCNRKENLDKIKDIQMPSGEPRGHDTMAIGGTPVERQAIVLEAIKTAEKFIYIPTFVMTEGIARAIAARKKELQAQGKELDIRVIIDSGLYSYGSTPNERGFFALEDADINARWSLLRCTNMEHARKIHAKEIITDKMILTGSTNMSQKGLRTNWELSGITYFDPKEIKDLKEQEMAKEDFLRTWNDESIEIDSIWLIDELMKNVTTKDKTMRSKEARRTLLLKFLREIDNYEKQVGNIFEAFEQEPGVRAEMQELQKDGFSRGYALLQAVKKKYPGYILKQKLEEVPARANLEKLRTDPHAR